eukprot:15438544-Alexandrium_andersonii.AAC.1
MLFAGPDSAWLWPMLALRISPVGGPGLAARSSRQGALPLRPRRRPAASPRTLAPVPAARACPP